MHEMIIFLQFLFNPFMYILKSKTKSVDDDVDDEDARVEWKIMKLCSSGDSCNCRTLRELRFTIMRAGTSYTKNVLAYISRKS